MNNAPLWAITLAPVIAPPANDNAPNVILHPSQLWLEPMTRQGVTTVRTHR